MDCPESIVGSVGVGVVGAVSAGLGTLTLTSNPTLPSTQNVGNTITFTASWSGGTSTYTSNSPEEANVVVTDSGTNTVTSGYSPTFTINPALSCEQVFPDGPVYHLTV